ncbi:MAG: alanine racemase [Alphaproteobacteria bacterium]
MKLFERLRRRAPDDGEDGDAAAEDAPPAIVVRAADIPPERPGIVVVDLDAIAFNWRLLVEAAGRAEVAAAAKADCYGTGMAQVAPALVRAGCRSFFVAVAAEGIALRKLAPRAAIAVLSGPDRASAPLFGAHNLRPVLNDPAQVALWRDWCRGRDDPPLAWLHVDTGMTRLGLMPATVDELAGHPDRLAGIAFAGVLSHLACADDPAHPMNARQLDAFLAARALLEPATGPLRASLANSAGVFLGAPWHFDLVRPGAALYGLAPHSGRPNPMRPVVHAYARIVQVHEVDRPRTVGYGATWTVPGPRRLALVAAGYADGYPRAAGEGGPPGHAGDGAAVWIGGHRAPVVGRVSMDLLTVDASAVPTAALGEGALAELLGPHIDADALGAAAGTIGYEVLARLGTRFHREWRGGAEGAS